MSAAVGSVDGPVRVERALSHLGGVRILVLNWRDVQHPEAGGAESYVHETARRWVAAGAAVTFLTARGAGQARRAEIDGIDVRRAGGPMSVYLRTALRLLRIGHRFDVVVDGQNGIPFFAPLFAGGVPVLQVVHHVHQDQFATRFAGPVAALGRLLEGPIARRVYARHRSVAVSPSTRQEMRRRLGFDGLIDVVPNGTTPPAVPAPPRTLDPTVVVVSRLVPHKRIELLLDAVAAASGEVPRLRVEIIGDGREREALRRHATALGLDDTVTFHGRLPAAQRDALLGAAWLTTCTSAGEGWGCTVLEAAAFGVPCLAVHAPGIRDSVVDGRTGRLVDPADLARDLVGMLAELALPAVADAYAAECRSWAAGFTWDRSADMLAAALLSEMRRRDPEPAAADRRLRIRHRRRSDVATLARFTHSDPNAMLGMLRLTDEIAVQGTGVIAILRGRDDVDALEVLLRIEAVDIRVRPANRHELLGGPAVIGGPATEIAPPAQGMIGLGGIRLGGVGLGGAA